MFDGGIISFGEEVKMIGRSMLTVNEVALIPAVGEAAVRDGRVGRQCGELFALALP